MRRWVEFCRGISWMQDDMLCRTSRCINTKKAAIADSTIMCWCQWTHRNTSSRLNWSWQAQAADSKCIRCCIAGKCQCTPSRRPVLKLWPKAVVSTRHKARSRKKTLRLWRGRSCTGEPRAMRKKKDRREEWPLRRSHGLVQVPLWRHGHRPRDLQFVGQLGQHRRVQRQRPRRWSN